MSNFKKLFNIQCPVIGMIHLQPLPGTPKNKVSPKEIIAKALEEAQIFIDHGIDGLMIENMHDVPYLKKELGPEVISLMSIIGYEIKHRSQLPCGIQILSSANQAALASAHAANMDFIRAEGFVYGHLADEGYIESCAGDLLRYRKQIGAENICILTDIKKKHSSHAITSDISLEETAKISEFFLSDGIIVTGPHTGVAANKDEIVSVRKITELPIIAGSGVTISNMDHFYPVCDALLVGSYFKKDGHWANDVDAKRVESFMNQMKELRT